MPEELLESLKNFWDRLHSTQVTRERMPVQADVLVSNGTGQGGVA
jgi:hypothetical protein